MRKLLLLICALLLSSIVFAQELIGTAEPTQSKYGPYPECQYLSWDGDEYCLWVIQGEVQDPTQELNIIKSKLLETISEDYYKEHFDLLMFRGNEALFDYKIDDYSFSQVQDYGTRDPYIAEAYRADVNNLDNLIKPREVTSVVDVGSIFLEARKCIGTKDVGYHIRENFTLLAIGDESVSGNRNHFEMNLETGEISCTAIVIRALGSTEVPQQSSRIPPCYDCWQDYILYIIALIVIVTVAIFWKVKKK